MGFFDDLFGGGDKPPPVTNPQTIIDQEDLLNRIDILTPDGSREFSVDPETGRSVLTVGENEFQQGIRQQKEALASAFLSDLSGGDDRFAAEAERIGDLTFERGLSRLEPTLEQARRRTETQLATSGLPVGSEAFGDSIAALSRGENDLLTQLAIDSELAASNEQTRLRSLALQEAGVFGDQLGGVDTGLFVSGIPSINVGGIIQGADSLNQSRQAAINASGQQGISNMFDIIDIGSSFFSGGF